MAYQDFLQEARTFHEELTAWRHHIHQNPETSYEEVKTSAFIQEKLTELGVPFKTGYGKTGVAAYIKGNQEGAVVGLRADIDALDIAEDTGVPYASKTKGKMHACGHDGHTTMLLGAAKLLQNNKDFAGTVVLVFQPAEEGGAGAKAMMDDGLLSDFNIQKIYALHNWPGIPVGQMRYSTGPVMAATFNFEIKITGLGGHAAMPHVAKDPVVVGAHLITQLQTVVSRSISPFDPVVVTVGYFHGGSATNIIPNSSQLGGTVRAMSLESQAIARQRIQDLTQALENSFGVSIELEFIEGYPVTYNTPDDADVTLAAAEGVFGKENVCTKYVPSMGGEDFSYFTQEIPGSYIILGNGEEGSKGGDYGLHHPKYNFNDDIIPYGAAYLSAVAMEALKSLTA